MQEATVTFETKCYENDWEYILKGNYLDKMIKRCGYPFAKKQLIINNVSNKELVIKYANKKKQKGIIDEYYFVDDTESKVLDFFDISKESLGKGFVYSISELTGIYHCTTDYLLHFSSDAFPCSSVKKSNWIRDFIYENAKNPDYITSTLLWNGLKYEAKQESYSETENFFICQGFSDQCYLIKVSEFKKLIYNEKNSASERYPIYGGELFEKRVDSFLRNTNKYRLVSKHFSYRHANFPKSNFKRFISLCLAHSKMFTFCLFGRRPNHLDIMKQKLTHLKIIKKDSIK